MGHHKNIVNIILQLKYKHNTKINNRKYHELFQLNIHDVICSGDYRCRFAISYHAFLFIFNFKTRQIVCKLPKNYYGSS